MTMLIPIQNNPYDKPDESLDYKTKDNQGDNPVTHEMKTQIPTQMLAYIWQHCGQQS
jgi:hypothetical protein